MAISSLFHSERLFARRDLFAAPPQIRMREVDGMWRLRRQRRRTRSVPRESEHKFGFGDVKLPIGARSRRGESKRDREKEAKNVC